jgi:hypothetical protein
MAAFRAGFRGGHRGWSGRGARQVLTAAIVAAPLLAAAPAAAQWFADDPMPPRAAARIAARHGFTGLTPPRLAGDVYILQAIDEDGARVRLVIDAYSGRILRPRGASVELAPPRPARRLRPWDYTPDDAEVDEEREPVERFEDRRWSRETLVPPRPIGRERPPELPLSREAEIDLDREPAPSVRPGAVERERRPTEMRREPPRRAARIDQTVPEAAPAQAPRARAADRASPPTPPPAVETPAPTAGAEAGKKPDPKPEATAALPAPTDEPAPASALAAEPSNKARPAQAPAARPPEPAKQPPAQQTAAQAETPDTTGASGKVRVIGGVAPVVPQKPGAEEGATSEPSKIAR